MIETLMPIWWVVFSIPVLVLLQRWLHRHIHGLAYLLTGKRNWAVLLYAIILFPGVLLHELSHWIAANLLGVRTGSFSVLPKTKADGSVQLGYVEYYKTSSVGPIRESLIGSAPLLTGTAAILFIAFQVFDVTNLALAAETGDIESLSRAITTLFSTNDFLIWLYLMFAISNAMMPSASDRKGWPAFALIMAIAAAILYVLGLQDVVIEGIAGPVATVFGYLGLAFSLTIGVDLFVIMALYIIEWIVGRLKGVEVVYGKSDYPPSG
jgi:hypothetical protein